MAVNGVESVSVSLEKGLAAVKLKPGNTVTLKQLQAAVEKNGFTMKESHIVAAGSVVQEADNTRFRIGGSNEVLALKPESPGAVLASASGAGQVIVDWTVPEAPKNKVPDSIRYRSLTQEN